MPTVTITITDTPSGAVSVHTDFAPAVGKPCSPAQAAALDILRRTRREYSLPQQVEAERLYLAAAMASIGVSQL
jgi:hypothetical protein